MNETSSEQTSKPFTEINISCDSKKVIIINAQKTPPPDMKIIDFNLTNNETKPAKFSLHAIALVLFFAAPFRELFLLNGNPAFVLHKMKNENFFYSNKVGDLRTPNTNARQFSVACALRRKIRPVFGNNLSRRKKIARTLSFHLKRGAENGFSALGVS